MNKYIATILMKLLYEFKVMKDFYKRIDLKKKHIMSFVRLF